jgi:hypothetical protein
VSNESDGEARKKEATTLNQIEAQEKRKMSQRIFQGIMPVYAQADMH